MDLLSFVIGCGAMLSIECIALVGYGLYILGGRNNKRK